jgi:hypothetical protein
VFPVRIRERLMDSAYPAWFMLCASSLLEVAGVSLGISRDCEPACRQRDTQVPLTLPLDGGISEEGHLC